MKVSAYILFFLMSFSIGLAYGDDKDSASVEDFEIMIAEYLDSQKYLWINEAPSIHQIIIFDSKGNITRQMKVKGEPELSVPSILNPLIKKAVFLSYINGTYYYILDQI